MLCDELHSEIEMPGYSRPTVIVRRIDFLDVEVELTLGIVLHAGFKATVHLIFCFLDALLRL